MKNTRNGSDAEMIIESAAACVHCHKCRRHCAFLSKYGIDIGDTERLRELAYHCFLCGTCTAVCPVNIDGRALVLEFRRQAVSGDALQDGPCSTAGCRADIEKRYKSLIAEKRDYRFRNWKHAASGRIFFPGCNFPSQFPATCRKLEKLLAANGIETVYDCCGKPMAELGFRDDEMRILDGLRRRLSESGVTEIVTACPNCMDFFGDRLGISVRSIYSLLDELGIGSPVEGNLEFYLPCPDRRRMEWIADIEPFVTGSISFPGGPQCCGLGGSAAVLEPELASGFVTEMKGAVREDDAKLVTYCASCMGQYGRAGFSDISHILALILGTNEKPDIRKSYINRVLTRFR